MTSVFMKNGNTFRAAPEENLQIHHNLPKGNYVLKYNEMNGFFYLEEVDSFDIPKRLYGGTNKNAERILNTFSTRPASTGVMLVGEKGSGKTLLARQVSIEAAKNDIPTIIINTPFTGDEFNSFIQSIDQACVILFDEFEKVFNDKQQEATLTLLDGVFPSKKLFILTCNDKYKVDSHLRNRPGRIFYMFEFNGLGADFIREYCEDNLIEKSYIERIIQVSGIFDSFNFDMLKAMVEEMNRYNESPDDVLDILNIKPEYVNRSLYDVRIWVDKKEVEKDKIYDPIWGGNPLSKFRSGFGYYKQPIGNEDYDDDVFRVMIDQDDLKSVNGGVYIFTNKNGETVSLTKQVEKGFNFRAF